MRDENFNNSLGAEKTDFYKKRYMELLKEIDKLRLDLDSSITSYHNSTIEIYKTMQNINNKKYSVFSLSIGANHFFYGNDAIDSYISPGLAVNFNPGRIFGIGRIIDIWADYYIMRTDVNTPANKIIENSTSRYSIGANLNIPLDEVFKIKDFGAALKIGAGYFHTNTECKNIATGSTSSNGAVIKLELSMENFNQFFPFGIYFDFDFNKYNKNLIFVGDNLINLNKPWVTSISAGLRFPLWQNIKDLP